MSKKAIKKERPVGGVIFVVGILVVTLIFVLLGRGKTTTIGKYPDDVTQISLTCINNEKEYPFFSYDNSVKKETKIGVIFGGDEMSSISLSHTLFYDSIDKVNASEAHNHANMGIAMADAGLYTYSLDSIYSKYNDHMTMSIYANSGNVDNRSAKFFLLSQELVRDSVLDIQSVRENYVNQGFDCTISE